MRPCRESRAKVGAGQSGEDPGSGTTPGESSQSGNPSSGAPSGGNVGAGGKGQNAGDRPAGGGGGEQIAPTTPDPADLSDKKRATELVLQKLQDDFNALGLRVFGSGWVFVTVARDGKLALESKPNQDTPLMEGKRVLIGNDVWEHAYYLTYQNRRADYLKAWWNVVSWAKVGQRYAAAKSGTLTI